MEETLQCGGNTMSQKTVHDWEKEFRCRPAADRPSIPSGCPPLRLFPG